MSNQLLDVGKTAIVQRSGDDQPPGTKKREAAQL
jgi:hypothetical protein